MAYPKYSFKTSHMDHSGLVAGMYDQLQIGQTLDAAIPQDMSKRNLSIGNIVKAMVINGLGFVNQTLYLTPEFFRTRAIDRLIGPDVTPEMLNDSTLGRCLDTLFQHDLELLFCKTSMAALKQLDLLKTLKVHLDSSSFHFHGQYDHELEAGVINIPKAFGI